MAGSNWLHASRPLKALIGVGLGTLAILVSALADAAAASKPAITDAMRIRGRRTFCRLSEHRATGLGAVGC